MVVAPSGSQDFGQTSVKKFLLSSTKKEHFKNNTELFLFVSDVSTLVDLKTNKQEASSAGRGCFRIENSPFNNFSAGDHSLCCPNIKE